MKFEKGMVVKNKHRPYYYLILKVNVEAESYCRCDFVIIKEQTFPFGMPCKNGTFIKNDYEVIA